jgi:hypothetical protein
MTSVERKTRRASLTIERPINKHNRKIESSSGGFEGCRPTPWRLAAPHRSIELTVELKPRAKIAPISWPRSGVSYSALLGRRQRSFAFGPHGPTTPASYHTARPASRLYHSPHTITRSTTSSHLSHIPHAIRLGTTGSPHDEHSYHRSTTGSQHHGRSSHTSTTSRCTTETKKTSVQVCAARK